LLKFYRSPLGRKMVREMPATLIDAMHATHRANHRRMEALTETLIRKGTLVRDGIKDSPGKCPGIRSRPGPPPPPPASGNGLH
jgi:hypothetical protein